MREKRKILIVDDERDIIWSLSVRLRAAGYDVVTANDGVAGLNVALEAMPDGILLDSHMSGIDGIQVLERLKGREETKSIPVIVVSASVVEQARAKAMAAGACCFVEKPFQPRALLSAVREMIGSPNLPMGVSALAGGVA